jgi:cyclohexadienyl dehydratase
VVSDALAARARRRNACGRGLAVALALLVAAAAAAEDAPKRLRVGTSGDYAPFSRAVKGELAPFDGFDAAVARRYAADRGLELEFVRFRWPTLLSDLEAGRFDVAMSGITLRPDRSVAGSFSVPVVEAGAVALVGDRERFETLDSLDRERVRIAVNAGGYLEGVARARFPKATILALAENDSVPRALVEEAVDAVVTDTVEVTVWGQQLPKALRLGPFTRDRKAYLVAPAAAERAADLDAWLLEREADGTLATLRSEALGPGPWQRTAEPLPALVAALDERLSLMPWVGAAKRREGLPLEDPGREGVVIDEAVEALLAAAHAREVVPPSVLLVRRFFRAQLEAAKQVQWDTLRDRSFEAPEALPALDTALRPAISRIGARIARLLLAQPPGQDREQLAAALADGLRSPWLAASSRRELVDTLAALSQGEGPKPQN